MNSLNGYPKTRESIYRLYNEILADKKTDLSKVRFLVKQIKAIREDLRALREIVKKPIRDRYYLGEFVTRGQIYDLQREEGVLRDMVYNLKGADTYQKKMELLESWNISPIEVQPIN